MELQQSYKSTTNVMKWREIDAKLCKQLLAIHFNWRT